MTQNKHNMTQNKQKHQAIGNGDQLTVTLCDTAIGTQLLIEQVLPDLVTDPNLDTCQQKVDHTLRV